MKKIAAVLFLPILLVPVLVAVIGDWSASRKRGWWKSFKEVYDVLL